MTGVLARRNPLYQWRLPPPHPQGPIQPDPSGSGGLRPNSAHAVGQRPLSGKRHGPHGPDRAPASRDIFQRQVQPCHERNSLSARSLSGPTLETGLHPQRLRHLPATSSNQKTRPTTSSSPKSLGHNLLGPSAPSQTGRSICLRIKWNSDPPGMHCLNLEQCEIVSN
jgi:hypothetical protein